MAFTVAKAFELVTAAHERGRLAHAFLVTGPRGSGKQDLAAQIVDMLNGEEDEGEPDLWGEPVEQTNEVPSLADQEGEYLRVVRPRSKSRMIAVDDIRALEKMMHQSVPPGTWKIGAIVDADRMNESSENAFLKTLEEPPHESLLMLLSSEPQKLLPTIWSRCVHLALAPDPQAEKPEVVKRVVQFLASATKEGLGSTETAFAIKAGLDDLLRERKAEIEKSYAAKFKEDKAKYAKVVDSKWMEDREKIYLAQSSADYLAERTLMVETIHAWVGDLVRSRAGGTGLEFPEHEKLLAEATADEDLDLLLRRAAAMEELRRLLETNVVEALALEVSMLRTFGDLTI